MPSMDLSCTAYTVFICYLMSIDLANLFVFISYKMQTIKQVVETCLITIFVLHKGRSTAVKWLEELNTYMFLISIIIIMYCTYYNLLYLYFIHLNIILLPGLFNFTNFIDTFVMLPKNKSNMSYANVLLKIMLHIYIQHSTAETYMLFVQQANRNYFTNNRI